jgi:hypothetical protein
MPTHDELAHFLREFAALSPAQQKQFLKAVVKLVNDLQAGRGFRPSLRIKGVQGHPGIFEMTWAGDGRATFDYGDEQRPGETHIIWRRIGGHDILKAP